ncbi:MAG: transporter substrate-binding domain-containing protein [Acidimicrobiia bacterium]
MNPRRLVASCIALVLVTAACGGGETAGGIPTVATGKLTVCTDAPYIPFEFQAEDGTWTGFDMDVMTEIATRLGLELAVTLQPFDGIWLAPAAGSCDIAAAALTITPEREANALFSDPYFDADQSLLVRVADEASITSLEDMAGRVVGVQTGTTGELYAQENVPADATLRSYDEPAAMFLALQAGELDGILQDVAINAERALQEPDAFALSATFPTGEQYGFATSPASTALMEAVNEALAELRTDGTYDVIYGRYFAGE